MDPKKKFFLFKQSEHFCSVPWNHVKVEMDGTLKTCVFGAEILGNLEQNTLNDIFFNKKMKDIRHSLYNDLSHKNCEKCVNFEDEKNYKHLRGLYNSLFKNVEVDYSNDEIFELSAIDLHWSSTCNLKCITCWANQSSAIAQEEGKKILHTSDEQADKIIDLILSRQYELKEIYLSGGEPTLIKHNIKLLTKLDKNINCVFRINTNMMFNQNNLIINELLKFKNVLVTMSVDSLNERFDYIRRNADWNTFVNNLAFLKTSHFKFRINSVFFVATALHLTDTQQYFMDNFDIYDFTINQVDMGHTSIRSRNLPNHVKNDCKKKILQHQKKYKENTNLFYQLNNCLQELEFEKDEDYYPFFDKFNNKTRLNWKEIFTELV